MIKIFISSTFSDMHFERDAIQLKILPEIKKRAETFGESFDFCDLRWGINTQDLRESDRMDKILQVCFREISDCSNCNCNTFMIVLLGERYGSCPDKDKLDDVVRRMNENNISRIFQRSEVEGKSYTNLEIEYAPFSDNAMFARTVFLFRDPMENAPEKYRGNQDDRDKLGVLKEAITKKNQELGLNNIIKYHLQWDENLGKPCGFETFITLLKDKLIEMLNPDFSKFSALTDEEKASRRHWMFVNRKAKLFNCAKESLEVLNSKLQEGINELYIEGPSGSGKSCLLCKLIDNKRRDGWNVYPFICNGIDGSITRAGIYTEWIAYLEKLLNIQSNLVERIKTSSDDKEKLNLGFQRLAYLFKRYTETKDVPPLLLAVDAADKRYKEGENFYSISLWSHKYSKVRFVYSFTHNEATSINYHNTYYYFVDIGEKYIDSMLQGNMSYRNKYFPNEIKTLIIKKCTGKTPYYINLLFKRLSLLDATDFINGTGNANQLEIYRHIVNNAPETEIEFREQLIDIVANKTNKKMIEAVIRYLAGSSNGLRRADLHMLIKRCGLDWDNADFSIFVNFLDEMFAENVDGRIDFLDVKLKKSIIEKNEVSLIRKEIFDYIKDLPLDDPFRASCIFDYCFYTDDRAYFVEVIQNQYLYNDIFIESFNTGNYSKKTWFESILKNPSVYGVNRRMVQFVTLRLSDRHLTEEEFMRSVSNAIVEYCKNNRDVIPSEAALAQLCLADCCPRAEIVEVEKAVELFENLEDSLEKRVYLPQAYSKYIKSLVWQRNFEKADAYLNRFFNFLQDGIKKGRFWCGRAAVFYLKYAELRKELVRNRYSEPDQLEEACKYYNQLKEFDKENLQLYNESMKLLLKENNIQQLKSILPYIRSIFVKVSDLFNLQNSSEEDFMYYADKYIPFIYQAAVEFQDNGILSCLADIYMRCAVALSHFGKNEDAVEYADLSLKITREIEERGLSPESDLKDTIEKYLTAAKMHSSLGNYEVAVQNGIEGVNRLEKFVAAYNDGGEAFELMTGFNVVVEATGIYTVLAEAYMNCGKIYEAYDAVREGLQFLAVYDGESIKRIGMHDNLSSLTKTLLELWKHEEIETQKIVEDIKLIDVICCSTWLTNFYFWNVCECNFSIYIYYLIDQAADACMLRNATETEAELRTWRIEKTKKAIKEKRVDPYVLRRDLFISSAALGKAYAKLGRYDYVFKTLLPFKRRIRKASKKMRSWEERYLAMNCYSLLASAEENLFKKEAKGYRIRELKIVDRKICSRDHNYYFANYCDAYYKTPNLIWFDIELNETNVHLYNDYSQKAVNRQYAADYVGLGRYYEKNGYYGEAKKNYLIAVEKCGKALELLGEEVDNWMMGLCYNLLGQCLDKTGDTEAFRYYNLALTYLNRLYTISAYTMDDRVTILFNRAFSSHAPSAYTQDLREEDLKQAKENAKELLRLTGLVRYKKIIKLINKKQ